MTSSLLASLLVLSVVPVSFAEAQQHNAVDNPKDAPSASQAATRVADDVVVNVREEGGKLVITIDRESYTLESLAAFMRRQVSASPDLSVRIRGEAEMSWQRMADVISTCSQAGVWNISFSKQMPGANPAAGAPAQPGTPAPAQP